MRYLLMCLTFIVGAIIPIQAILNSRLGKQTGGALMGSLMSFFTGFICLVLLNLIINGQAIFNLKPLSTGPWYIWLGGFIGSIFVGYITWVNQQQGMALTFALVVSGQIFVSLLIDQFGLFGSAIISMNPSKIIGAILIVAGIILVKK